MLRAALHRARGCVFTARVRSLCAPEKDEGASAVRATATVVGRQHCLWGRVEHPFSVQCTNIHPGPGDASLTQDPTVAKPLVVLVWIRMSLHRCVTRNPKLAHHLSLYRLTC